MKQDIKDQWVAALRSGDYAQTRGYLRDNSGFCCLGVLCDIAAKSGVVVGSYTGILGSYQYGANYEDLVLPPEVQEWAGIRVGSPRIGEYTWPDGGTNDDIELSELNDEGVSFSEIADLIEERM
ncbi:hypothetical protein [Nocardia sp. NPDC057440]|uniref:hypothetical protein n=1 Tax=Nocardia sp. NPDC057440 TaxID=3346134 RepID=UPI00367343F2